MSWQALKTSSSEALSAWKAANPKAKVDDAAFWMTGEHWGQGIERTKHFDAGFDNMINFDFQERVGQVSNNAELDRQAQGGR